MQARLYANITNQTLSSTVSGSNFSLPNVVAGADLTVGLALTQRIDGRDVEVRRTVTALQASLGRPLEAPNSGATRLHLGPAAPVVGENVTESVVPGEDAASVQAKINALSQLPGLLPCVVQLENGVYSVKFADEDAVVELKAVENLLKPVAFATWKAVGEAERYVHELSFVQTPVAETVDYVDVASPVPTIEVLQDGGANGDVKWREVQKLVVPPDFSGAILLKRGYRRTGAIGSQTDVTPEVLADLADAGGEFVTTEVSGGVRIEFGGEMSGQDQDPLEVEVLEQAAGVPTFTLQTKTPELFSLLQLRDESTGELELELDIKLWVEDVEGDEPDHPLFFKQKVTIVAPVSVEDWDAASEIDWGRPRGSREVLPWTPGQVLIGNRGWPALLGNGVAVSFAVPHNLNAPYVHIEVRENHHGGRLLSCPGDYNVIFDSDNQLTITPDPTVIAGGVLGANAWLAFVTVAADEALYKAHGHAIGEIAGLQAQLAQIGGDIQALQDSQASGALALRETPPGAIVTEWMLDQVLEAYPSREMLPGDLEALGDVPPALLPRDGGLVGAVHDAAADDFTEVPVIDDTTKGKLYRYTGDDPLLVEGGLGRRSIQLRKHEHIANDGRVWYRVEQAAGTTSWFPEDFDREICLLAVNSKQLIAGRHAELKLGFEAALRSRREAQPARYTGDIDRNVQGRWEIVIEHGAFAEEDAPATTAPNLANVTWDEANPILSWPIVLTRTATYHSFGVRISRDSAGDLSSDAIYYGASEAGGSVPASADFALRARLRRFDIVDGVPDPRGVVLLRGMNVSRSGDEGDDGTGKLIIR